jgi:CheY-like chemotaxis protein
MDDKLLFGKTVLLIEDETFIAMMLEDLLKDLGCKSITVAVTVEAAMDLIAQTKFDVATLDVNLDGTRSLAVAKALRARDIPFAFATGNEEHGFGKQFQDSPVLKKPFNFEDFKTVVGNLVGNHAT